VYYDYSGWKIRQWTCCTENNCWASLLCELSCVVVRCLAEKRTSSTENNCRASLPCELSYDAVETGQWRISYNTDMKILFCCVSSFPVIECWNCFASVFYPWSRVLSEYDSGADFLIIRIQHKILLIFIFLLMPASIKPKGSFYPSRRTERSPSIKFLHFYPVFRIHDI
jgi:hypothetical protein